MQTAPVPFSFNRADFNLILPQLELTLFGLGILLIDFWMEAKAKYWNAVLALAGTGFSGYTLWMLRSKLQLHLEANPRELGLLGFQDTILVDAFFLFFAVIFLAATALVILLSIRYMEIEGEQHGEYYALMLFACAGMMFMASGVDLIVLFLGLETMAISFYVLTGFLRRTKRSNEAALKYVLLGAFSSGILAYGFSLLYGMSPVGRYAASTNIFQIGEAIRFRGSVSAAGHLTDWFTVLAFVTVATGLFFKVAAVPFHQWAPDVYEGAPTPIAAYVSVASKTASFALLLRLFIWVFGSSQTTWTYLLAGVAIASLTWGNFAAITQTNIKRLLAYSSIAHVGYILLGLVSWNQTGVEGIAYYLFVYAFMTTGAFAVVIVLRQQGLIGDELEDLNGLYQRSPAAAVLLLIFMLSLAGIPPTAGFLGKYFIFQSLIETRHPVLAVFAALYIVPSLYYYFRVVVHAWMKEPGNAPRPVISLAQTVALTIAGFVTLAAGVYPEPFAQLARYAFGLGR
jgi:NADH-quinone oxidoreductase subunit N